MLPGLDLVVLELLNPLVALGLVLVDEFALGFQLLLINLFIISQVGYLVEEFPVLLLAELPDLPLDLNPGFLADYVLELLQLRLEDN